MKTAYCFDLDGTLTQHEILPILSKELNLFEEIAALTEATIKGIIPFERSFALRVRILSEIPIDRVQNIIAHIPLHLKILSFIESNKDSCFIISGNLDVWIKHLADRIGCRLFCSTAAYDGNKLLAIGNIINKADIIKQLKNSFDRVVAVGDGMGDVSMFEEASVNIAFAGVHKPIQSLIQLAHYICPTETSLCNTLNML